MPTQVLMPTHVLISTYPGTQKCLKTPQLRELRAKTDAERGSAAPRPRRRMLRARRELDPERDLYEIYIGPRPLYICIEAGPYVN